MKKKQKNLLIIGLVIIGIILIVYFGFKPLSLSTGTYTGYKTFTFSSDYKSLVYTEIVGPDYNILRNDNAYLKWNGGNDVYFNQARTNPQLEMFYLINSIGVNKNDIEICATDNSCLSCGCDSHMAVCPTSEDASNRVSALIAPYGLSFGGNPSDRQCPTSYNKLFLEAIPDDLLNSLSNNLICKVSGKYRGCNANGNDCGSEIDYNINGQVTWQGENGFNCYLSDIPSIPSGYGDIRASGNVTFSFNQCQYGETLCSDGNCRINCNNDCSTNTNLCNSTQTCQNKVCIDNPPNPNYLGVIIIVIIGLIVGILGYLYWRTKK